MMYSNLSKIRPKLRTQGNVTGNFGRPKAKAGSSLNDLGMTTAKTVKCVTQDEYLTRLYSAYDNTTDQKLRQFIYTEIRKIHVQRGTW
jgi:hypothetical protein